MQPVEDLKIINVDDTPYAVEQLPEEIQQLVGIMNTWLHDEADAKSELLKVQAAIRDVSREIVIGIRKHVEAENAKKAEAEAANPEDTIADAADEE